MITLLVEALLKKLDAIYVWQKAFYFPDFIPPDFIGTHLFKGNTFFLYIAAAVSNSHNVLDGPDS